MYTVSTRHANTGKYYANKIYKFANITFTPATSPQQNPRNSLPDLRIPRKKLYKVPHGQQMTTWKSYKVSPRHKNTYKYYIKRHRKWHTSLLP